MWGPADGRSAASPSPYTGIWASSSSRPASTGPRPRGRSPATRATRRDPAYVWPAALGAAVAASSAARHARGGPADRRAAAGRTAVRPPNWAPPVASDFADFAYAAARRYPTVHVWMIWGEPTRRVRLPAARRAPTRPKPLNAAQRAAPHRYAQMLDAAYVALKRGEPAEPGGRRDDLHDRRHRHAPLDREPPAAERSAAADGSLRAQPVLLSRPRTSPTRRHRWGRSTSLTWAAWPAGSTATWAGAGRRSDCSSRSGRSRRRSTTSSTSMSTRRSRRSGSPTACASPGAGRVSTPWAGSTCTTIRPRPPADCSTRRATRSPATTPGRTAERRPTRRPRPARRARRRRIPQRSRPPWGRRHRCRRPRCRRTTRRRGRSR